jgi:hypothetical protein
MSLVWNIDTEQRVMTMVTYGDVTLAEVDACLDAMAAGDTLSYRKLFDGSRGDTSMGPEELMAIGWRIRNYHQSAQVGPLAVVFAPDKMELVSRVMGMLAAADRSMRVFVDGEKARSWLYKQPVKRGSRWIVPAAGEARAKVRKSAS